MNKVITLIMHLLNGCWWLPIF